MKPIPIFRFPILPPQTEAMVLWPFMLFRSDRKYYLGTRRGEIYLRHELQHVYQVERNWYYVFYLLYFVKWLRNLFKYKNTYDAYMQISYEIEARAYERVPLTDEEWKIFVK